MIHFIKILGIAAAKVRTRPLTHTAALAKLPSHTLGFALHLQIGIIGAAPTTAELRQLAVEMFELALPAGMEPDHPDASVGCDHFVSWAKAHVIGQSLLQSMDKEEDEEEEEDDGLKTLSALDIKGGSLIIASNLITKERFVELQ